MNLQRLLFCPAAFFLLNSAVPLLAEPEGDVLQSPGTIDAVTVFSDRALVERRMDVHLKGRRVLVRFTDLPGAFSPDAMRARAEGLEVVSLSLRPIVPRPGSEGEPLRERIESLRKQIRAGTDRQANYAEQMKILEALARLTGERSDRELREGNVQLKAWADSLQFIEERRGEYQEKNRLVEAQIADLQKSLKEASDELGRLTDARRHAAVEVEVVCEGKPGDSGIVRLSYMVGGVSWQGVYDLYAVAEKESFRLESHAIIRQKTGEDWKGVKITLSSARPSLTIAPPVLTPWRLHAAGGVEADGRTRRAVENVQSPVPSEGSAAESSTESSALTVDLSERLSIAGDGSDQRVTVHTGALKGKIVHVVVPGRSEQAFFRATLKNETGRPLLLNRVNIFLDGGFIGTATPGTLAANGEEFHLYLGPDRRMHVKRSLVKGEIVGSGLITKTVEIENRYQIEVANFTMKPRTVVVYERVPVSADPGITTRFLGSSLPGASVDAVGLLTWTIEVSQGETKTFDFGYSIQIPQPVWEALERREAQSRQSTEADSPAPANQAPTKRKYDLEKMFMH